MTMTLAMPVSSAFEVRQTFRIPEWLAPEVPGGARYFRS
jgi:hypothetical protein